MTIQRVRVVWTGVAGSPYYTNLYFGTGEDAVGDPQGDVDAVEDFLTNIVPELLNPLHAEVVPEVALINEVTGDITGFVPVNITGKNFTNAGEALPRMTQMLLRLRTGTVAGGRRVQGRVFIPGMPESANLADGRPNGALTAGIRDAFIAQVLAAPDPLVVWSRKNGVAAEVGAVTAWSEWAVLRSRRD